MNPLLRLRIDRLGRRGEGVGFVELGAEASADVDAGVTATEPDARPQGPIFVPFGLPGETVMAEVEGDRGRITAIVIARPDRIEPFCPYYGRCGGCAVQTLPHSLYAAWKRDLVVTALDRAGLSVDVAPLVDAHGAGRRRASFHARFGPPSEGMRVGFMQARAHAVIDLDHCPILSPAMASALPAARRIAGVLARSGKPLDLVVTASESGLDVDLRGLGPEGQGLRRGLVQAAADFDLARLSNHGETLVERRAPILRIGEASVILPAGAFLQATAAGEMILADAVLAACGSARRVVDLFCGLGTFALRLAARAGVQAFDAETVAIAALDRAARGAPNLRPIEALRRDLYTRPLRSEELSGVEALVFDPPRAGAEAQAIQIARASVPVVVAVSCDPVTFARDAALLVEGGYRLEQVTPIDQFRHSAHVEIVGVFRKSAAAGKTRRLLS